MIHEKCCAGPRPAFANAPTRSRRSSHMIFRVRNVGEQRAETFGEARCSEADEPEQHFSGLRSVSG